MASLQSLSPAFNTKPPPRNYYLPHGNHSIAYSKFQIRCNAAKDGQTSPTEDESTPVRLDRRSLLFAGVAANLAIPNPPVLAQGPLRAPELARCGVAVDLNQGNAPLDVNCCPPFSDNIIDYTLPPVTRLRTRPDAHRASAAQIANYERAVQLMRNLPDSDPRSFTQQANIHCAYCNGAHDQAGHPNLDIQVHNCWLFYPFHRWYLYFYERILGRLIDDPDFALPFWKWDNPEGMTVPPMFTNVNSSLYNTRRDPANMPPTVIDLGFTGVTDEAQRRANNLATMYNEMVRSLNTVEDFMGMPYGDGSPVDPGPGSTERGSHTAVHVFVGDPNQPSYEDMGNFYSAGRDPIFYTHHSNVDRMWTVWRGLNTPIPKDITSPDYLDAEFLFYDENAQLVRVRVRDCVDNQRMGYTYEDVGIPWFDARPARREGRASARSARRRIVTPVPDASTAFPATLNNIIRAMVPKSGRGKVDEVLLVEDIETDESRFIKFDVFIDDEDENFNTLNKPEFAGSFAQVPHKVKRSTGRSSISLRLTDIYDDIDVVDDDDTVMVTIVPRSNGNAVTIGRVRIISAQEQARRAAAPPATTPAPPATTPAPTPAPAPAST